KPAGSPPNASSSDEEESSLLERSELSLLDSSLPAERDSPPPTSPADFLLCLPLRRPPFLRGDFPVWSAAFRSLRMIPPLRFARSFRRRSFSSLFAFKTRARLPPSKSHSRGAVRGPNKFSTR